MIFYFYNNSDMEVVLGDYSLTANVSSLLVFLEGFLSFFSPCVLPLIPVYISYLAGNGKKIGSDGTISFNKLLPGEYTIKETKAPEGYELSSKTFFVTVEGNKTAELELVKSRPGVNNNNDTIKNESDGALTEGSNGPKGPETPKTPDAPKNIGTLPNTGYVLNTWMLAALGLLLIAEGIFLRKRRRIAN
ncbi:MAG TPA: hypothetical protein DEF04_03880 [Clostridiales bacterium]|nr:hypothetical protein [Clostridiales bacterium]